ncbi:MAG TPA: hypothetical protein PLG90_10180 [Ignavibacteria bacterium]|nr:hypothetical protein [Ignavibacteria bacterium]
MKNNYFLRSFLFSFIAVLSLYLAGCVNVDQDTKLNADGSGSINLEYWTKMSNVASSDELGGFSFTEDKARKNYESSNTTINSLKVEDKLDDSTKHVYVDLDFKDINTLNSAKGFEKIISSWKEGKDGMDFSYTVPKDTTNSGNMGASDTKLIYTFEFPDEVISTNGRKDGKKAIFEKTLADLKEDLVMTATVKGAAKKGCGLFGIELPLILLVGLTYMAARRRKK